MVTPLAKKYYRPYKCKAENVIGSASTEVVLEEAHVPSEIQQAIMDKYTATTIRLRFVPPTDSGGLPIESYAAEYKEDGQDWNASKRRVWAASPSKFNIQNLILIR